MFEERARFAPGMRYTRLILRISPLQRARLTPSLLNSPASLTLAAPISEGAPGSTHICLNLDTIKFKYH